MGTLRREWLSSVNSATRVPLKSHGTSVKAIGYGGLCRTNSVDVKNIAYHEQSDCRFDHAPSPPEKAANRG